MNPSTTEPKQASRVITQNLNLTPVSMQETDTKEPEKRSDFQPKTEVEAKDIIENNPEFYQALESHHAEGRQRLYEKNILYDQKDIAALRAELGLPKPELLDPSIQSSGEELIKTYRSELPGRWNDQKDILKPNFSSLNRPVRSTSTKDFQNKYGKFLKQ